MATDIAAKPLVQISTDFLGAQSRNKRNSVILCLGMVLLAMALGYIAGWATEILTGAHPNLGKIGPYTSTPRAFELTAYSEWGATSAVGLLIFSLFALVWTYYTADRTLLVLKSAHEADPEKFPVLHNVVEEMAIAAGLEKPAVYVIPDDGLNAFATGLRPDHASITVTTGLYENLNRAELQGVVGHEMAHILNRDVQYAVLVAVGAGLIAVFAEGMLRMTRLVFSGLGSSRRSSRSSKSSGSSGGGQAMVVLIAVAAVLWVLAAIAAPLVAQLVRMAVSREREYLADATSAQLTRNPKGLASALQKIAARARVGRVNGATEHLYIINPNRAFSETASDLFSTHPATSLRIERLMNLE